MTITDALDDSLDWTIRLRIPLKMRWPWCIALIPRHIDSKVWGTCQLLKTAIFMLSADRANRNAISHRANIFTFRLNNLSIFRFVLNLEFHALISLSLLTNWEQLSPTFLRSERLESCDVVLVGCPEVHSPIRFSAFLGQLIPMFRLGEEFAYCPLRQPEYVSRKQTLADVVRTQDLTYALGNFGSVEGLNGRNEAGILRGSADLVATPQLVRHQSLRWVPWRLNGSVAQIKTCLLRRGAPDCVLETRRWAMFSSVDVRSFRVRILLLARFHSGVRVQASVAQRFRSNFEEVLGGLIGSERSRIADVQGGLLLWATFLNIAFDNFCLQ